MYTTITDFRKTPCYSHMRLRYPYLSDYELVLRDMDLNSNKKALSPTAYFLPGDLKGVIETYTCLRDVSPLVPFCDGIYDIWLRNCKNVREVCVEVEGAGTVYKYYLSVTDINKDFQVPLAFHTNGVAPVSYYLYDGDTSLDHTRVSFIPVHGSILQKIYIKLNEGAIANIELSTVYLPKQGRSTIRSTTLEFYINGKALRTNGAGSISKPIDDSTCVLMKFLRSVFGAKPQECEFLARLKK